MSIAGHTKWGSLAVLCHCMIHMHCMHAEPAVMLIIIMCFVNSKVYAAFSLDCWYCGALPWSFYYCFLPLALVLNTRSPCLLIVSTAAAAGSRWHQASTRVQQPCQCAAPWLWAVASQPLGDHRQAAAAGSRSGTGGSEHSA